MKSSIPKFLTIGLATGAMLTAGITNSQAVLLSYEGFAVPGNYSSGISISGVNGGTGWTSGWSAGGFDAQTGSPSFTNLATTPGQARIIFGDTFNFTNRSFAPISTGNLWVSWLYTPGNPSTDYSGLGLTRTGGGDLFYIGTDGNGQLRIDSTNAGGSNNSTVTSITNNVTNFIVANINYTAGTAAFYVNPSVVGGPGTATISTTGTFGEVGSLLILGNGNGITGFDEIRLGTTYADVAPIPEPSTIILMGAAGLFLVLKRKRHIAA